MKNRRGVEDTRGNCHSERGVQQSTNGRGDMDMVEDILWNIFHFLQKIQTSEVFYRPNLRVTGPTSVYR